MDRIAGLGQIVRLLRKKISRQTMQIESRHISMAATSTASVQNASVSSIDQLEQRILKRFRTIDLTAADGKHKCVYVFVESILVWEMGEDLLKDPEFDELVGKVSKTILGDERFDAKFSSLLASL
jgi:hypothetical protein